MPDTSTPNAEQIADWNERVGRIWVDYAEQLDRQLGAIGEAAMARAAIAPGEAVLEIGCGSGATALALARRSGPDGRVTGVDISAPMLALARERAAAAGVASVEFVEADAQVHAFPHAAFDLVFSRFGVMFFADPAAAFANIRRAATADGRLAFVCWRTQDENPWMNMALKAAAHLFPPPEPPPPGAPGPFAFADPQRVRGILDAAGWRDIAIEPLDVSIGGNDLEQTTAMMTRIGPLGAALRNAGASPELIAQVEPLVRETLRPHLTGGGVFVDSASWLVTARAS